MLTYDHPLPPNRYYLQFTGFYHPSQIGIVQCQKALVNALIERWHLDTHTFHLPIGECAVALENVAVILGLPTNGLPVTGITLSSFEVLEGECFHQFGVSPTKSDCRGTCIKLTWLWDLKERLQLIDENSIQRLYSWGSACLVHLYRSLCRASCFNCKKIDGPLTLLLAWVWIRLPYLAPVPRKPRSFSLSNRYSLDARHPCCTSSGVSKGLVSGDSSRSDDSRGILNSQKPWHVSMSLIEENAKTVEHETNEYLIDEPDDEDEMTRKVKMRTWMRIKNPAMMLLMMVIMQVEF
ncbi:uncharacterized protein DS421_9g273010 [Arachis hypogaea]|nr:uncharacterized protein DS421_9g273010 [Arachis hypogaea]